MKFTKILFPLVVAGMLTACGNKSSEKPTDSTDTGNTPAETVDMTQGVYNCVIQKYELLIKFYENNVYYMHNENNAFKGKYEIREEAITYSFTQDDGTIADTATKGEVAKWVTGNKAIYFFQEDGATPINFAINTTEASEHNNAVVEAGIGYAHGTATNALAYDEENDKIISLHGVNFSRTLTHVPGYPWSAESERDIIQAKYMVASLPADAEEGNVESDYFLSLSQKGYQTNIKALNDLDITAGKFAKNGNVYTLTDTISAATATLTVTETGATVAVGETSVALVPWEEVGSYAALLKSARAGELRFNEDGTFALKGSITITGTYCVDAADELEMEFDENAYSANLKSATIDTAAGTMTVVINVTAGSSMDFEFTGAISGTLYRVGVKALLEVDATTPVYASNYLRLSLFDDCTATIGMQGNTFVNAFYSYDSTTHRVAFYNVDNGELTFALGQECTVTWANGSLNGNPQTNPTTFKFAGANLALLEGATVKSKATFTGSWNSREVVFDFKADGSLAFSVGGRSLATAKWAFSMDGGRPSFTFTEATSGTFSFAFTSATEGKFNWNGDPGAGTNMDIGVTFSLSELGVFAA